MKNIPKSFLSLVLALAGLFVGAATATSADQPNIIFIMADDLGYGDLGCYGQKIIQTPRLDRMAAEGMRFTQFYAGATVCAPSRCVLMTGKHTGHCKVRGNGGGGAQSLGADDFTVAELLKGAGYSTGLIGKWGLGDMQPEMAQGMPTRKGFDYFFGYANQSHAHNYYPAFLWRNESMVGLRNEVRVPAPTNTRWGIGAATVKVDYTHDLFATEALDWVREHKAGPFFLFLSLTIPHANNEATRMTGDGAEVPDYGIYADEDWPDQDKGQAAMITRMDRDVGRLLDLLKELSIAEDTLVIFTSDNGPHDESGHDTERFDPSGPLRGMKRDLYEGGIRVPTIAWWPETVAAGTTSDHVGYFGDIMTTAAELAGADVPEGLDSISFAPTLKGDAHGQRTHEYLYWEFYERGGRRAVRWRDWKGVRPTWHTPIELYNLASDIGESTDVATDHPAIIEKLAGLMDDAHETSADWKIPVLDN